MPVFSPPVLREGYGEGGSLQLRGDAELYRDPCNEASESLPNATTSGSGRAPSLA